MNIDASNIGAAMDLLTRGFPQRSRQFWEKGITRLLASPAHKNDGEPIGTMMMADGRAVGIALSAASYRPAVTDGARSRLVNLCSWYIDPDHRWRMPVMLRNAMRCKSTIYTDLSPTENVRPMLEMLGFKPLNNGVEVVCVPSMAARQLDAPAVVQWRDAARADPGAGIGQLMADHESFGCYAFAIETAERSVPLIVKPFTRCGVPMGQVVYCGDASALGGALGSLSRTLVWHGRLGLVVDLPIGQAGTRSLTRIATPSRRRRYIKNGSQEGVIDYAYSELVFFEL